mmetsp:Transcript_25104/g.94899  ORF Transcript_25104/g.94899 Transcript_25104/m.94899 type:complete len:240 (+) Transcript_25104:157-876(+)
MPSPSSEVTPPRRASLRRRATRSSALVRRAPWMSLAVDLPCTTPDSRSFSWRRFSRCRCLDRRPRSILRGILWLGASTLAPSEARRLASQTRLSRPSNAEAPMSSTSWRALTKSLRRMRSSDCSARRLALADNSELAPSRGRLRRLAAAFSAAATLGSTKVTSSTFFLRLLEPADAMAGRKAREHFRFGQRRTAGLPSCAAAARARSVKLACKVGTTVSVHQPNLATGRTWLPSALRRA